MISFLQEASGRKNVFARLKAPQGITYQEGRLIEPTRFLLHMKLLPFPSRSLRTRRLESKAMRVFSGIWFLVLGIWFFGFRISDFGFLAQAADAPRSGAGEVGADHAAKMTRGLEVFKKHVQPILVKSCVRCHGGKKTEGELDLTDREGVLRGGGRGPAILAGNAQDSLLYKLITHARDPHMPRASGKLSDEAIAQVGLWIDLGAPYDKPLVPKNKVDDKAWIRKKVSEEDRQFWSFQPIQHAAPPSVKNENWCRTPIDRFILAKLEASGITPNPPVAKERLIRRVYFDLIGLPPGPEEVRAFVND